MRASLFIFLLISMPAFAQNNEEAKIKTAVEDRYQDWLAAANTKDAAAMTNLYDENAVLLPKSEEAVLGKVAIGEYYKKLFADPHFVPFTLKIDWNSFHATGDVAIATSTFEGDATREGKPIHFRGKNFSVWEKETDGSWKILRYMYDEIPPPKK